MHRTLEQIAAMHKAIRLGKQLQTEAGYIAMDYLNGVFITDIVRAHNISRRFKVNQRTAEVAVKYALEGFQGSQRNKGYRGLVTKKQFQAIGQQNRIRNGELYGPIRGQLAYENGTGIHSQTTEQRRALGQKGGAISRKHNLGIHARTSEEMTAHARLSVRARGRVPYDTVINGVDELTYTFAASLHPDFHHTTNKHKGRPDTAKIAAEVNAVYHDGNPVRDQKSTRSALVQYRSKYLQLR